MLSSLVIYEAKSMPLEENTEYKGRSKPSLAAQKGDPTGKAATVAALAKEVGVPERTARRRLQVVEELKSHPDLKEAERYSGARG